MQPYKQLKHVFMLILNLMIAAAALGAEPFDPLTAGKLPRYLFFNKTPGMGWHQAHPENFTPESFEMFFRAIGTRGNSRLRVGLHFIWSMLEQDLELQKRSLQQFLASSEKTDVPVLLTLDGQNCWQTRSDLWNWWDSSLPGFDEDNRFNVEWTNWGPEHAVKIAWRNWGSQIRIRPAPNIASPRVLAEHWKGYDALIPIIVHWHQQLPREKKYLWGGVKVGWEASINVNAYYYQDGNRIYEASPNDASKDPDDHHPKNGWTFNNAVLGYAAATSSGMKKSGPLTKDDIEELTTCYLRRLTEQAYRRGVPAHLLFTHQGGNYAPWDRHLSFKPAIQANSIPGWSFYSHDPPDCGSLAKDMDSAGRTQWAASEWWRGAPDTATWCERFRRTLTFKHCRFICIYNWEPFAKEPAAIAAVRELVQAATTSTPASE